MTFARNPSPCPMPRVNPERKDSSALMEEGSASAPPVRKILSTSYASSGWQPLRKFVSPSLLCKPSPPSSSSSVSASTADRRNDCEAASQGTLAPGSDQQTPKTDSSLQVRERSTRLSQRIRELYDFKTENEWPTRVSSASPGRHQQQQQHVWISKSSSEDEKYGGSVGKNTQDLEFNDRRAMFEMKTSRCGTKPRHGTSGSDGTVEAATSLEEQEECEVFVDSQEERWRRFNDRLRYSEDLGREQQLQHQQRQQRRTYSDDYEEKRRRDLRLASDARHSLTEGGGLRSRDLRGSYVEIESVKRNSRASEASYVSIDSCFGRKRSSNAAEGLQVIPMRGIGQIDKDDVNEQENVSANRVILERHKRASTRYKVYLT